MSVKLHIKKSPHNWEKTNLTTKQDQQGQYDAMVCVKCGVKGKRRDFTTIEVDGRHSDEKIYNCNGERPDKVEITSESASNAGSQFENLKVGTVHETVPTPEEEKELSGVWVMGVDEPVRLLPSEYKPHEDD
jgi:hypothetical protein